ncbi:MAG: diguanylate cyclase [Thiobacillaceae bacterium]
MISRLSSLLFLLFAVLLPGAPAASQSSIPATPISAMHTTKEAIGRHVDYIKEADGRLTLEQVVAAWRDGKFTAGQTPFLNFGIGSQPVWIHFSVDNSAASPALLRMSVETAWLDQVDVYFRQGGTTAAEYHTGDRRPLATRPVDSRYYVFDHSFAPGVSDVFLRVETPDPMLLPIHLMPVDEAHAREMKEDYSYGFLYGFLFALLAYNAVLYTGMGDARYRAYALYLGAFLLMNASYTGHGFRWLWTDHYEWAQWSNPVLMVLYAASGLFFALRFLDTREHFPRMHKAVLVFLTVVGVLLLASVLMGSQLYALLLAFSVVLLFPVMMLGMGVFAARSGKKPAIYFLLAAIAAMVGAALTGLAVWGFIPTNIWTYRAVDIGIMVDATLLALALAYQFRVSQEERLRAEQLATLDPLTGINNRRAFHDKAAPIWNVAVRYNRNFSIILLDIDAFKRINDQYGHAVGDEVLKAMAKAMMKIIRDQDVLARWGGEEFILLLPETSLKEAVKLAERLRHAIADLRLDHIGAEVTISASIGVVERGKHHASLDAVISAADKYLYQSKETGRNKVSFDTAAGAV